MKKETMTWMVRLSIDGKELDRQVTISAPFGIPRADAEVKAIKRAQAAGGKDVRALDAWLVSS